MRMAVVLGLVVATIASGPAWACPEQDLAEPSVTESPQAQEDPCSCPDSSDEPCDDCCPCPCCPAVAPTAFVNGMVSQDSVDVSSGPVLVFSQTLHANEIIDRIFRPPRTIRG